MNRKAYKARPPLKIGDLENGNATILFEECVDIPGLEGADIRMEFDRGNSFAEIQSLLDLMRSKGMTFVVTK